MRVLLLTHAFNSLAQRLFVDLRERGHTVTVEFDIDDAVTAEAVDLARPDVVVAPFLKRAIPEAVWRRGPCLVVHPGPPGDRGPSALDWAILDEAPEWGVTVLQAEAEMDAGPVWAHRVFPMRAATKSSLYRNEVTEAAVAAVVEALERLANGDRPRRCGRHMWRPPMRQADRAIDWRADDTATVLRKIRSADGHPGLRDTLAGLPVMLHDAHPAPGLSGLPGALIARARDGGAVCRATRDGAVWLGHLRRRDGEPDFKLPASLALGGAAVADLPVADGPGDVVYEERAGVGYLHFAFHNGALGVEQCRRLLDAFNAARRRPTRVLVLTGGPDFWCNGIHLNLIEAADSPADESWRSINAIDDLARAIVTAENKLIVAVLRGGAGAGGVFLALAADRVLARRGVVLNPHYKGMGNLYGSEYWTYLLPRRCGAERAEAVTQARLPMGVDEARRLGLVDTVIEARGAAVLPWVEDYATRLAADPHLGALLAEKRRRRAADEAARPLDDYRREELLRMKLNFYGFDPSYHVARYNFVRRVPKSRTPPYLATHRRRNAD